MCNGYETNLYDFIRLRLDYSTWLYDHFYTGEWQWWHRLRRPKGRDRRTIDDYKLPETVPSPQARDLTDRSNEHDVEKVYQQEIQTILETDQFHPTPYSTDTKPNDLDFWRATNNLSTGHRSSGDKWTRSADYRDYTAINSYRDCDGIDR
jgi:hypothetical protein